MICMQNTERRVGNLISDSYIYAVKQAEGEDYEPVDLAVVATGVIRDSFPKEILRYLTHLM